MESVQFQAEPKPSAFGQGDSEQEPPLLYSPEKAARIAAALREGFDPECILLFGSLAGGTPHSDVAAYDLLVVMREEPYFGWPQVTRYLKYKLPPRHRDVPYANIYIYTPGFMQAHPSPFFWFARSEGALLWCSDRYNFRRPHKRCDFRQAYCEANLCFDTFFPLGVRFLAATNRALTGGDLRQAAFFAAQAAVLFYHTLFFMYHGFDTDTHDPVLMHQRLRTLSGELMLLFDSDSVHYNDTMPCLKRFLIKARYDPHFEINPHELEEHIDRVEKMKAIVEKVCQRRLELYKSRAAAL